VDLDQGTIVLEEEEKVGIGRKVLTKDRLVEEDLPRVCWIGFKVAAAEVEEVEAEAGQVGNRDIKEVTFETNTDIFACIMFLVYYLYLVCCNTSHSFRASLTQKAIERETREIGRQGERSIYSNF